jgi:hypothetical protein
MTQTPPELWKSHFGVKIQVETERSLSWNSDISYEEIKPYVHVAYS